MEVQSGRTDAKKAEEVECYAQYEENQRKKMEETLSIYLSRPRLSIFALS